MKYSIDKIDESIVLIQNIDTGEKKELDKSILPEGIKEGDILIKEEKYLIDNEETNKRKQEIENRFNNLIQ